MHRNTNFVKYLSFSIEAFIQTRDHDVFIIVCILLSVFRIHRIIWSKMSVVFISKDRLNETTKVKKSTYWVISINNRSRIFHNWQHERFLCIIKNNQMKRINNNFLNESRNYRFDYIFFELRDCTSFFSSNFQF